MGLPADLVDDATGLDIDGAGSFCRWRCDRPGARSRSHRYRSSDGISCSTPARRTRAVSGTSVSNARRPRCARPTENSSRPSLIENKNASIAASWISPSANAPPPASVINVPTPILARRSDRSVPGTKVRPPTPAASTASTSADRWRSFQPTMKLANRMTPAAAGAGHPEQAQVGRGRHQGHSTLVRHVVRDQTQIKELRN